MIIIALLIAGASWQSFGVNAATTATFGNTSIGSLVNSYSTNKDATRFQLSKSGIIISITVYFVTSGFEAKAAIYADSNGAPNQLIAQSRSEPISSKGWHQFAVLQKTLTPGYYWLSVVNSQSNAQGAMSLTSTANQHTAIAGSYAKEFTLSFGTQLSYDSYSTSIYATFIPATTPSHSQQPSPTRTPTPARLKPTHSPPPQQGPTPTPPPSILTPIAFRLYSDQACKKAISKINWGELRTGTTQSVTIYVRNEGKTQITLFKSVSNWNPANAADYIKIEWDYSNQLLDPGSTLKLTLTATVSSGASTLNNFSHDLTITATS